MRGRITGDVAVTIILSEPGTRLNSRLLGLLTITDSPALVPKDSKMRVFHRCSSIRDGQSTVSFSILNDRFQQSGA